MTDVDSLDSLKADAGVTEPDDFVPLIGKVLGGVRFKYYVFLFFIALLIFSDVFVSRMLSRVDHAVEMGSPTSYGKVIQSGLIVLGGLTIDLLTSAEII